MVRIDDFVDPLVKEAYTQLVPLEMSESEFWIKYFKSEYFVRDKSTSAIGGLNSGSAGGGIQRTDDMFSKFEKKNPPLKDSSVLMSRVDLDHSDVDLSSSAADVYKHTGTYCMCNVSVYIVFNCLCVTNVYNIYRRINCAMRV